VAVITGFSVTAVGCCTRDAFQSRRPAPSTGLVTLMYEALASLTVNLLLWLVSASLTM